MVTHSSMLAWEIPWTEEPDRPQPMGSTKSRTRLSTHMHKMCKLSSVEYSLGQCLFSPKQLLSKFYRQNFPVSLTNSSILPAIPWNQGRGLSPTC